mmetsp:Transcript_56939/g.150016  ORF Transcript_56939/g.150016 Transcript_56939/m.150016 type:complete len:220 (+) Transcript_56939:688-1347(+)
MVRLPSMALGRGSARPSRKKGGATSGATMAGLQTKLNRSTREWSAAPPANPNTRSNVTMIMPAVDIKSQSQAHHAKNCAGERPAPSPLRITGCQNETTAATRNWYAICARICCVYGTPAADQRLTTAKMKLLLANITIQLLMRAKSVATNSPLYGTMWIFISVTLMGFETAARFHCETARPCCAANDCITTPLQSLLILVNKPFRATLRLRAITDPYRP